MGDYAKMWEDLGMDLENHDLLCQVLPTAVGDVFLSQENRPKAINYVYGLGGRDFRVEDCTYIFDQLDEIVETGKTGEVYRHIGQRE